MPTRAQLIQSSSAAGATPLLLGLDLGTSSLKALAVMPDGVIVAQAAAGYPIHVPAPGHAEQDPAEWWAAAVAATRQVMAHLPDSAAVAAIGVTGQMHGTVLLDRRGEWLGPAVIWPDQRSAAQADAITAAMGKAQLAQLTGSPVATGFQAATLAWLRVHRPDRWATIGHVLTPTDELRRRLTGVIATDPSDASGTLLFDVTRRIWAAPLLDLLALDPAWLPPVQPSASVAGTLTPQAAADLGLPPRLPVVTGGADTPCSALAAGAVDPATLLITLSSGGQLLAPSPMPAVDPAATSHTFCNVWEPGPDRPGWYRMAALLNVGLATRWLVEDILALSGPDVYARLDALAASAPLGSNGLIFLPYLAGERTPLMDPQARGAWIGLTTSHGRADLARAVLEGISLACYDAFSALTLQPTRIVLAGGGAASPFWRQMIADVFGAEVHPLATASQSALGAALLAGAGVGLLDPMVAAQRWATTHPPLTPDPARHVAYQARLPLLRRAYAANRDLFAALTAANLTDAPMPA